MRKSHSFSPRFMAFVVGLCTVCSCRLGEPTAFSLTREDDLDASEPNAPSLGGNSAGSGGAGGGAGSTAGMSGLAGDGSSGAAGEATAGTGGDAGAPVDDDVDDDDDASITDDAGATSCSPEVQLCNPVTNEGCPPSMQCAVDLAWDVLAGYCIFSSPPMPGCFNSGVTESCPPSQTCFDFECRTLCFCDADCDAGQCCKEPIGTLGFKVCGDC
jgi:hypothetical protein